MIAIVGFSWNIQHERDFQAVNSRDAVRPLDQPLDLIPEGVSVGIWVAFLIRMV